MDATHLLVACNPHHKSLTVQAMQYVCTELDRHNIRYESSHLDNIQYDPILSQEEIYRRSTFDSLTLHFQNMLPHLKTLALFFPDWWGLPPALLVGWLQRVFAPGVAFVYEEEHGSFEKTALLSHLEVALFVSSDEPLSDTIAQSTQLLEDRLFRPSGVTKVHTALLAHTHKCSTHEKNLWFQEMSTILLSPR